MVDKDDLPSIGDPIVREARKRFKKCERWESTARQHFLDDMRFDAADDLNMYQWGGADQDTSGNLNVKLTVNKTRVHNLHIINDAKQRKSSVKFRAVGDGATKDAAEVYTGLARHIYDISRAQDKHGQAIEFQVRGGVGYTYVYTDYIGEKSFDQDIYLGGLPDPMAVYLDPDHTEKDGSDARFGFIYTDRPRDEAEELYPWLKDAGIPQNAVDDDDSGWLREDHVRECKYYTIEEENDELIGDSDGNTILKSDAPKNLIAQWEKEAEAKNETLRRRDVITKTVWIYQIVGDKVVKRDRWAGSTIPIIPWIGEENIIDQTLDRRGHTRGMRDPQRMLNYNRSAGVEYGALQSKVPWMMPMETSEESETYLATANTENHAYIPYKSLSDAGVAIPPPTRQQPPQASPAFAEGASDAEKDLQMVSGQYDAEMGAPSNEKSGRAINERQRMGDRATYQFTDNQGIALRREGSIFLELIPVIYDTKRVLRVLGEDGTGEQVQVDPDSEQAHMTDGATVIFNPNVGRYSVVADIGPDYATDRQEEADALMQLAGSDPSIIQKAGDLIVSAMDFSNSEEIAERLKPAGGLPPEVQQQMQLLQGELAKQTKLNGETMQALAEERLKAKARDATAAVDEFKADTERTKMLIDAAAAVDPQMAAAMIKQMAAESIRQANQDNLGPVRLGSNAALNGEINGMVPPGSGGQLPVTVHNPGQAAAMPGGQ